MGIPNMTFIARLSLIALLFLGIIQPGISATSDIVDWEKFLARNDLTWTAAPKAWDEGPFLGNGFVGAYLYHDPKNPGWLRVEPRSPPAFFTCARVCSLKLG